MYRRTVRLVGACHIALGEACLGAYPGAFLGYYGNRDGFASIGKSHCNKVTVDVCVTTSIDRADVLLAKRTFKLGNTTA